MAIFKYVMVALVVFNLCAQSACVYKIRVSVYAVACLESTNQLFLYVAFTVMHHVLLDV